MTDEAMNTYDVLFLRRLLTERLSNMQQLRAWCVSYLGDEDNPVELPPDTPMSIRLALRSLERDAARDVIEVIDRHKVDIKAAIKEAELL